MHRDGIFVRENICSHYSTLVSFVNRHLQVRNVELHVLLIDGKELCSLRRCFGPYYYQFKKIFFFNWTGAVLCQYGLSKSLDPNFTLHYGCGNVLQNSLFAQKKGKAESSTLPWWAYLLIFCEVLEH